MRSLLYFLARQVVGWATFFAIVPIAGRAPGDIVVGGIIFLVVALAIGMLLSAPMYLAPVNSGGWSLTLPIMVWLFLFPILIAGWVGRWILAGAWNLVGRVFLRGRGAAPAVGASSAPGVATGGLAAPGGGQGGAPGYGAPPAAMPGYGGYPPAQPGAWAAPPPRWPSAAAQAGPANTGPGPANSVPANSVPANNGPGWQRDPTGRNLQRYWDGQGWTAHVANGSSTAIDPM